MLDRTPPEFDELEYESGAEVRDPPFGSAPMELQDSDIQKAESRLERGEATEDRDFGDEQDAGRGPDSREESPAVRRRRRRRGRHSASREDAFLGIERLATEDIVDREAAGREVPPDVDSELDREMDRELDSDVVDRDEITAVEFGGDEEHSQAEESEQSRQRRHRRRRGRRSRGRSEGSPRGVTGEGRDDRSESRSGPHAESPEDEDEDEDENDSETDDAMEGEEAARPSKSLHREVTSWREAIGFIVNTNLEARARSPGGGQKRWERRN